MTLDERVQEIVDERLRVYKLIPNRVPPSMQRFVSMPEHLKNLPRKENSGNWWTRLLFLGKNRLRTRYDRER